MQMLLMNLAMIRGAKAITEEIKTVEKEYWIINNIAINNIIMCIILNNRKFI